MKKMADVKYPNAANLFLFCRRVLDHKFGGIRVIDQDVGQILGFDPADCSHWKKGKKNIRSIQAMRLIAEHLGVDERLVVDVAAGDLDDNEAFYEFTGYGVFSIDAKIIETAKKDFYRRHAGTWTKEKENEFRDSFNLHESTIDKAVAELHERINFQEAPLYLPEIATACPDIVLKAIDSSKDEALKSKDSGKDKKGEREAARAAVTAHREQDRTHICYTAGTEMRPYVRYSIARAMAAHFLPRAGIAKPEPRDGEASFDYRSHLFEVQSNLFAAKLLAPAHLIRKEIGQVVVSKDIVAQLAEVFWVSKAFMNRRLKDLLQAASV